MSQSESDNPERIYLQPKCCADPIEGREVYWGNDPPWDDCDAGEKPVEYVRSDLVIDMLCKVQGIFIVKDDKPIEFSEIQDPNSYDVKESKS